MIKDILLPERIGSYYLFSKRIVGFELTPTAVYATVVHLRGTIYTIEACYAEPVEQDNGEEQATRTAKAIKTILNKVKKYTDIYTAISSSHVVFKSMKLPFERPEKIKMVIDFEVEPLLPFQVDNAVIDFIITKTIPEEKSSEILVAGIQKQYITQLLETFGEAGVQPQLITVDMFALYGFYRMIPSYANLTGGIILLDMGWQTSKMSYLSNGQLRFIRTITHGTDQIIKAIADTLSIPVRKIQEDMCRFGFDKLDSPGYT